MAVRFRTAMYERVSRDDGEDTVSESIRAQQKLLEDFCLGRDDLMPARHYSDDGYTGVKFDRPAFAQMLMDAREGRIDCVLVKDLSRLGRDMITVGEYLERVFPNLGIRFIAINDSVDSLSGWGDMTLPVTNLLNAQYARDISEKVRTALKSRRESGMYLCPSAPYGYEKDREHRGRLIPNKDGNTVKWVYGAYLAGMGKTAIASELNRRGIPSPGARRASSGFYKAGRAVENNWTWSAYSVDRMLHNPVYAGDTPAGKTARAGVHGGIVRVSEDSWKITRDTHEAIVDREVWEKVQSTMRNRSSGKPRQGAGGIFSGLMVCGVCGGSMKLVNCRGARAYMCARYKAGGPAACSSHSARESWLCSTVLADVNRVIFGGDAGGIWETISGERARERGGCEEKLARMLRGLAIEKRAAYERYREGKIDRRELIVLYSRIESRIADIGQEIAGLQSKNVEMPVWVSELLTKRRIAVLDRETVRAVVKRITVYSKLDIEVRYSMAANGAENG